MPNGTPSNVTLGPGWLYAADVDTTEPTSASATLPSASWTPIGYTDEGNTFSRTVDSQEVEVAEELDPVRYVNVKSTASVKFAMAETLADRLALAMNMGVGAWTSGLLEPPAPADELRIMLAFQTDPMGASSSPALYIFRQCYQTGAVEIASAKAPQKRLIAVEFNLEKPDGKTPFAILPNADGLI